MEFVGARTVRFATFTLKHTPHLGLREQIDRLYTAFSNLRRRKFFPQLVTGGAAVLEVKIGKDGLWHPHLHTLLEGKYLDQWQLSHQWLCVTGDSSIVDVRKVSIERNEVRYVSSYIGKPLDASIYADPARLDEFIKAIKGRRLIVKWGTWSKLNLDHEPIGADDWIRCGTLASLIRDADTDPHALRCLQALTRNNARELGLLTPLSDTG